MSLSYALLSFIPIVFCVWRGAKRGRWAEGFLLGAALGFFGVLVAIFWWDVPFTSAKFRFLRRDKYSWSGPGISAGCIIIGLGILSFRVIPLINLELLKREHVIIGFIILF